MSPKTNFKLKLILPAIAYFAFLALAGSASAATYYVDATNGNDSWTGTAGAFASGSNGPWKTISKVNNFIFQPGDDVYFKCGEVWNLSSGGQVLSVDWSGVDTNNYVVVGSYFMSGTGAVHGVSGNKPRLVGNLASFPSNFYLGLISIYNQHHVKVENLRVESSYGYGILIEGDTADFNIISKCEVFRTRNAGIMIVYGDNCVIEDNTAEETSSLALEQVNAPAAIGAVRGANDIIIRRNFLKNNYAEGLFLYFNINGGLIEDNVAVDSVRMGIYISGNIRNVDVRRNLVYYSSDTAFWRYIYLDGQWVKRPGYGIGIEDEIAWQRDYSCGVAPWHESYGDVRCHTQNIRVYDNVFINNYYGVWMSIPDAWKSLWNGSAWTQTGNSVLRNIYLYNNNIIAPYYAFKFSEGNGDYLDSAIRNNLITCAGATPCSMWSADMTNPGISWSNNLWPVTPLSPYAGSGDIINANAGLTKTNGWRALSAGSLSPNDFKLQSTSPAINRAAALGSPYDRDYFSTARPQGAGWDIGAHEYAAGGGDTTAPVAPIGLAVR